jgi:hypothetical protein
MSDMTRREFAALVGGVGLLFAVKVRRARAQAAMPVVGFLNSASPDGYVPMVAAFGQGLSTVRTRRSSTSGRKTTMTGYQRWRPIWFKRRSRSSPRPPHLRR